MVVVVPITDKFYLRHREFVLGLEKPMEHNSYYYILAYELYFKSRSANGNKPLSFCDYKIRMNERSVRQIVKLNNLTLDNIIQE